MQRIGRRSRLKPESVDEYVQAHRTIWPEMQSAIEHAGIRNYSIYRDGLDLFSYFEVEDLERAAAFLEQQPIAQKWQDEMSGFMDAEDALMPWRLMEEVFHLD